MFRLILPLAFFALAAYGLFFDRKARTRDKVAVLIMSPIALLYLIAAIR